MANDWLFKSICAFWDNRAMGCSVTDCEREHVARSFCDLHYRRWLYYGDPMGRFKWPTAEDRLQEFTVTEDGCHEWNGARNRDGYGVVQLAGKRWLVHRLAWTTFVGAIPEKAQVLHSCDNPPCFAIEHLRLGDDQANRDDMVNRGRSLAGLANPRARLNRDQVIEIRRRYALTDISQHALAREFGVHVMTINALVHRQTYKSMPVQYVRKNGERLAVDEHRRLLG
jgi:HNH endonuclease